MGAKKRAEVKVEEGDEIFVTKLDSNGNWLWAESAGGSSNDEGYAISTDSEGNLYVTGFFYGSASFGYFNLTSIGRGDIFVTKIGDITSVENKISSTINNLFNYPNPFNSETNIQFDIKDKETGILTIFNVKGQILVSKKFSSGRHDYFWNAENCGSGIYFYKLQTDNYTFVKKMVLLK